MLEQIVSLAQTLSGAEKTEQTVLEALCAGAESYWKNRLRAPLERCTQSFICAAAFTAAACFAEMGQGDLESFSAGDVSVRFPSSGSHAGDGLRRAAENLMAPFANPDGVWLKGVSA